MRLPVVFAAALALTACGKHEQAGNTAGTEEGLTAQNIVANDVTAIDAVTGDAANMAADADVNFTNEQAPETSNAPAAQPASTRRKAASKPPIETPAPQAAPTNNAE